jgi:hypothetical protein
LTAITGPDFVDRGTTGVVDEEDWGYWVKFDYGMSAGRYNYRSPYMGYMDDGTSLSYSVGRKEVYYLNSIETRSHIALFVKGTRTDGWSAYRRVSDSNAGHPTELNDDLLDRPIPLMYLDEIVLLNKADYKRITTSGFAKSAGPESENGYYKLAKVYDLGDVASNASFRSALDKAAIRKVKFGYETNQANKLCGNALNSFADTNNPPYTDASDIYASKGGKLTLRRLQFYGRNSIKTLPDYKFDYGVNPSYNKDRWDGWGAYSSGGNSNISSHTTLQTGQDAAAWSLTKIALPTGGEINVEYESDTYSSISGEKILNATSTTYSNPESFTVIDASSNTLVTGVPSGSFQVGDEIYISGQAEATCSGAGSGAHSYSGYYTVASLAGTSIYLNAAYMGFSCSGGMATISRNSGSIRKVLTQKRGGNVRVASIALQDGVGRLSKTKYSYDLSTGVSSGVVAREPEFIKVIAVNPTNFGLDDYYDYPMTPVIYGRVSVSTGYDQLADDYATKQVFEFEVPDKTLISETKSPVADMPLSGYWIPALGAVSLKQYLHRVEVKTAKIGTMKSIKVYDKNDVMTESTAFQYAEDTPNQQGKYTAGTLVSEITSLAGVNDAYVFRLQRTMKTYYPWEMTGIVRTKDGLTESKTYKSWDFYTGEPIATESVSKLGARFREEKVLAYSAESLVNGSPQRAYPNMGLKAMDIANKNMLSQAAATYSYKLNNASAIIGLVGAQGQTWSNAWANYRAYDGTTSKYKDFNDATSEASPVWRMNESYTYRGSINQLRSDGTLTFGEADKYSFTAGAQNIGWSKMGQVERYDHYGMPVESKDQNNIYSSVKMGYEERLPLCKAWNAHFNEIAFSSAEDRLTGISYFGGEVGVGSGTVVSTPVHTGYKALSLSSGYGFVFKTDQVVTNKAYRASVWANSQNGRIYYKMGATGMEVVPTSTTSTPVNVGGVNWYKIDVILPANIVQTNVLEIGVKSSSGTVVFDDFRFQPADAEMTCFVHRPLDQQYTIEPPQYSPSYFYVLDNNNVFMKYEYDEKGDVVKIYSESIRYGVKQISESKSNYGGFKTNP